MYNYGEEDFFTSPLAIQRTKSSLTYSNSNGLNLSVIGFAWCWDASWTNPPSGSYDPVFHTRWAGSSEGGADGNKIWGLDAGDSILTGNRVNMNTYLNAVQQYIDYCVANNLQTKVLYTTGPIDNTSDFAISESGYQQYLKYEFIRNKVNSKTDAYLFDFADILSYNDAGVLSTTTWTDNASASHTFPIINPENLENFAGVVEDAGYHFGEKGALRISKALWWMLARIAGWDGSSGSADTTPPTVPDGLHVTSTIPGSISIAWNASTDNLGVTGYRIYREGSLLGTSVSVSYTDNTISLCNSYAYSVSAIDSAGNESSRSSVISTSSVTPSPPVATLTHPTCNSPTGTIQITSPLGVGFEYSINAGLTWSNNNIFSGLTPNTSYSITVRNTTLDPGCTSVTSFNINPLPASPPAPVVTSTAVVNTCPSTSIDLTSLVSSTTPTGGSLLYKTTNNPLGINVTTPSSAGTGMYYIFYQNADGCYSSGTGVSVTINACPADITPTLVVSPNIMHGLTAFDLVVRISEVNNVNTSGTITVYIPKDPRWILTDGYNGSLSLLGTVALNNNVWSYSSDANNHIFTSTSVIPARGYTTFGFRVTFNPGSTRGIYTITSQIVSGGGGEVRISNNVDSEKIDYFQQ